ncbi:MAG: hypothetical protein GOMPHAMPRED_001500 [Gomphillus americanus]|uniref:Cytochrome b5 heme-binding domain-containing protein n=1 Tax=Gomphillus americanus TaxID=1940652 RepID=A0A8H3F954_9LECA|nr:MAG: hypothetical protein GOMPHAMPRED_001500 [Gomphillus americanus]
MAEKELTYAEVAEHKTKKDLYVVVHDKIYNASSFIDEHPGGEEVLMDVAGQDATDAFEDVGHSDEAREILDGLIIGSLKRQAGDPKPSTTSTNKVAFDPKHHQTSTGLGVGLYFFVLIGGAAAYYGYQYLQQQQQKA